MNVEFTKHLKTGNWSDLSIALNNRKNNLLLEQITDKQARVVEKLKTNPNGFFNFEEFGLINELAVHIHKMWQPKDNLKIYFFGGLDKRTEKVFNLAREWSNYCSITFQITDKLEESSLRVAFNEPGSWSYLGTDAIGIQLHKPTINFGWLVPGTEEREYRRVVLHEFGHALGLLHEHQSPAAKVNWGKDFVYWYCQFYFKWSRQEVDDNIFYEFEKTQTKFTEVDKKSIMGYWIPPKFTIDQVSFPLNYDLSDLDKKYIGEIYP